MKYTIEMIQDDIDNAEPQTTQDGAMNLAIERCIDKAYFSQVMEEFIRLELDGFWGKFEMSKKLQDYAHDFYAMPELTEPLTFMIEITDFDGESLVGIAYLKEEEK